MHYLLYIFIVSNLFSYSYTFSCSRINTQVIKIWQAVERAVGNASFYFLGIKLLTVILLNNCLFLCKVFFFCVWLIFLNWYFSKQYHPYKSLMWKTKTPERIWILGFKLQWRRMLDFERFILSSTSFFLFLSSLPESDILQVECYGSEVIWSLIVAPLPSPYTTRLIYYGRIFTRHTIAWIFISFIWSCASRFMFKLFAHDWMFKVS